MSNGAPLHLYVVSPERKVLEEGAESVTLPAADGYVTILPRHAPLIATLGVGVLTWRRGGRDGSLAIVGGFFEVSDDRVTVLADEALAPEEIDAPAARRELEQGRTALATAAGEEQKRARLMIERAQAKLAVAQKSGV
jgi:F-type H+-transporting ATPase subunit epsilon